LEGVYDPIYNGFLLSAKDDDCAYALFGTLDHNGDFDFAEITVSRRHSDGWQMKLSLVDPAPAITMQDTGYSLGISGVPSGLAHVDQYIPYFKEDEGYRRWTMVSPAAIAEYILDPELGYLEEGNRWNIVHMEAVNDDQAKVVIAHNEPTPESLLAAFNTDSLWDGIVHNAFMQDNFPGKTPTDLYTYYITDVFPDLAKDEFNKNVSAITAALAARTQTQIAAGWGVWWVTPNIVSVRLWDDWITEEEEWQNDPFNPWAVEGWNAEDCYNQMKAEGKLHTANSVDYVVGWDWSFQSRNYRIWRDGLTRSDYEAIQNAKGLVFYEYMWKFQRHVTSDAYYEMFLLRNNVVFRPLFKRYLIEKDSMMGIRSSWLFKDSDSWESESYSFDEALAFNHLMEDGHKGGDHGGLPEGPQVVSIDTAFSAVLSAISGRPESDFINKTMSEVFTMLNNINDFKELRDAIDNYMAAKIPANTPGFIYSPMGNAGIKDGAAPANTGIYELYSDMDFVEAGLRNTTRVRPSLMICYSYMVFESGI